MGRRPSRPPRLDGLPAAALVALYIAAALAPLALAAFTATVSAGPWSKAGSAAGMIGAVMLLLQLVSSGRFEALSGRVGIDVTMAFHKWAAKVMIVVILLHPLLFLAPVTPDNLGTAFNLLVAMLGSPRYLTGVIALVLVVTVVLLAVWRNRLPVPYEAWRAGHGLMALAAVWAAVEHILTVGTYSRDRRIMTFWLVLVVAASAAALGVYTVRAWRMSRQTWQVTAKRRIAERLWEITVRGKAGERLSFKAGQFAWFALAPRRFPLFDHPFSIASSPEEGHELSFIIKEVGDFTNAIGSVPIATPVGLDAPHGSFTLDRVQADAILLVAGGAGVAPILSLLRDLAARSDPRPVRLVYGCRSAAAMIDPSEFQPSLDRLDARAFFMVDNPPPGWAYGVGPVSKGFLEKILNGLEPQRLGAMLCGPGPMMSAVTDTLHELGVPLRNIRYERFDYAARPQSAKDRRITAKDRRILASFWLLAMAIIAASAAFAFR
jgi:predicted ferric reductase